MGRTTRKQQLAAWLCGAGLLLCILGYAGMKYLPKTAEEEMQDQQIRAHFGSDIGGEAVNLLDQMRMMAQPERKKPYELPGKFALVVGVGLTLCGLILWFQNTTPDQRFGWTRANDDA